MEPLKIGLRNLDLVKSKVDLQLRTQDLEGLAKLEVDLQLGTLDLEGGRVFYVGHHESMRITPNLT